MDRSFRRQYERFCRKQRHLRSTPRTSAGSHRVQECVNALAKELIAESDTMIDELRETATTLEQKIDEFRKMSLVKPKKPTKQDIKDFEL